jgi:hypothetical protein
LCNTGNQLQQLPLLFEGSIASTMKRCKRALTQPWVVFDEIGNKDSTALASATASNLLLRNVPQLKMCTARSSCTFQALDTP